MLNKITLLNLIKEVIIVAGGENNKRKIHSDTNKNVENINM